MKGRQTLDCFVEASLNWTPLTILDLAELVELCDAIGYFDNPVLKLGLDEIDFAFNREGEEAVAANAVCGRDSSGSLMAYGWNHTEWRDGNPKIIFEGTVHPSWRDRKIGSSLVRWQLDRAKEWCQERTNVPVKVWFGSYVDEQMEAAQELYKSYDFTPERYFVDLHHPFANVINPPPPPSVEGIEFVQYKPQMSEEIRKLHNLCFSSLPGASEVSMEDWQSLQSRSEFRPEWSWVARDHFKIVGYAMNSYDEQLERGYHEGWTDRVGVHPDYRGRRIAHSLLSWSMWSFGKDGMDGAGLGVDVSDLQSLSGLYTRVGYELHECVVLLSKTETIGSA